MTLSAWARLRHDTFIFATGKWYEYDDFLMLSYGVGFFIDEWVHERFLSIGCFVSINAFICLICAERCYLTDSLRDDLT
ncbi:hypothetical protein BO443_30041 [Burkholderia orbicola]